MVTDIQTNVDTWSVINAITALLLLGVVKHATICQIPTDLVGSLPKVL